MPFGSSFRMLGSALGSACSRECWPTEVTSLETSGCLPRQAFGWGVYPVGSQQQCIHIKNCSYKKHRKRHNLFCGRVFGFNLHTPNDSDFPQQILIFQSISDGPNFAMIVVKPCRMTSESREIVTVTVICTFMSRKS